MKQSSATDRRFHFEVEQSMVLNVVKILYRTHCLKFLFMAKQFKLCLSFPASSILSTASLLITSCGDSSGEYKHNQ